MEGVNVKRSAEEEAGPSSGVGGGSTQKLNDIENPSDATFDEGKKEQEEHAEEEEEEEEEEEGLGGHKNGVFVPGPLLSLKEQIERDKEDESLRRWKEKLLGCLESDLDGKLDPEVKFHSIGILSEDFGEIVTPLPVAEDQNGRTLFTLREGSRYLLKLKFSVLHNIVSGLTYSNTVWKGSLQVDQSKGMLGTFAPQKEPYEYALKEDTTPAGALARGVYSAILKFEDDDKRCHMELKYLFEIKKKST